MVWNLGCRIAMIDDSSYPPWLEASFTDAGGRVIRVRDKEPIFRAGDEPAGEAALRCRLVAGAVLGDPNEICRIDLEQPDGLAAADGSTTFDVRARQLAPATRLPEGWFHADRDEGQRLLAELHRELSADHPLRGVRLETYAHRDGATDDVAFRHLDEPERITVVHLTWSGRAEVAGHPTVDVDGTVDDLIAEEARRWGLQP